MAKNLSDTKEIAIMDDVTEVKHTDDVIVFKVNKPVSINRFQVIDEMVRSQAGKSGLKIVLMPYSCDLEEQK